MPLTGDFAELRQLASRLDRFSFDKVVKTAGTAIDEQYRVDFDAQRDPWGEAWKNKSGKAPANIGATGQLAQPAMSAGGKTIRLKLAPYWVFNQTGANNASERAVVPFGNIETTVWAQPIKLEVEATIADQLGKKP